MTPEEFLERTKVHPTSEFAMFKRGAYVRIIHYRDGGKAFTCEDIPIEVFDTFIQNMLVLPAYERSPV